MDRPLWDMIQKLGFQWRHVSKEKTAGRIASNRNRGTKKKKKSGAERDDKQQQQSSSSLLQLVCAHLSSEGIDSSGDAAKCLLALMETDGYNSSQKKYLEEFELAGGINSEK